MPTRYLLWTRFAVVVIMFAGSAALSLPAQAQFVCAFVENDIPKCVEECTIADNVRRCNPVRFREEQEGLCKSICPEGSPFIRGCQLVDGDCPAPTMTSSTYYQVPSLQLKNPLGGVGKTSIPIIIGSFVERALAIIGSITLLIFLYGGFTWMTAAGSAEKVQAGSQAMLWAIIGLFIIFSSYAILNTILTTLGQ